MLLFAPHALLSFSTPEAKCTYKTPTTCDADDGCTWCKCGALPSQCWTIADSKKLPPGVYDCDKKDAAVAQQQPVTLVTFDGSATDKKWQDMNDPVMGGKSKSSFAVADGAGKFSGKCAIVPFLKAPGFCKIATERSLFAPAKFADASAFIDGSLYLTVKSSTPTYKGFKVDFGAKNLTRPPGSMSHGGASLKANFQLPAAAADAFVTVKIPFSSFSVDWSDYTGDCDTKDPNGYQHVCCDAEHPGVCPQAHHLANIESFEVWAEGVEGDFELELQSIAAGP